MSHDFTLSNLPSTPPNLIEDFNQIRWSIRQIVVIAELVMSHNFIKLYNFSNDYNSTDQVAY